MAEFNNGDQVVITPVEVTKLTLEQRLAAYDPERHGGEQMTTGRALVAAKKALAQSQGAPAGCYPMPCSHRCVSG